MLVLAIGGVLVGFAFLVVSFLTENSTWAWGCIAACVAAAMILFIDARSRRTSRPTASPDAVKAPAQQMDTVVEGGVARDDSESGVDTTTVATVLEVRTGLPGARRADPPAPAVEPDLLAAAREPDHSPEPMAVPAALAAAEPELGSEVAPVPVWSGPVHDEAPVPPGAHGSEPGLQAAPVVAEPVVAEPVHDVIVVDEHPCFHLPGCTWLVGRETMSLPAVEAVELGFTPCDRCSPDREPASPARV